MEFEYDIFISYAASDDSDNDINLWATRFCHYLSIVLNRVFDRKPVILLHDDLRARKKLLGNNVEDIFSSTAVFVTLLAPEYTKNSSYLKELEEIYDAVYSSEDFPANFSRIFKIITLPIAKDTEPECLQLEISYNFFEINRFSKKAKTFDLSSEEPEPIFWSKLVDLAYDIYNTLITIKTSIVNKNLNNTKSIYLAETSLDQQENRDIIKRELQHIGYQILPLVQLPDDADQIKNIVEYNINNAILSIHLLGSVYGDLISKSQYSLVDFQNRIVKEYIDKYKDRSTLNRIIWIPNDLKPKEQRQLLYLKRLMRDDPDERTEIVEAPLEVLKTIIRKKLLELENPDGIEEKQDKVYLVYEKNDNFIEQIIMQLAKSKYKVVCSEFKDKSGNLVTEHRRNLIDACAVLLYKGKSSDNWLKSKIKELIKVPGYGKGIPFKAVGVIADNDIVSSDLNYINNLVLLKNSNDYKSSIDTFIKKLNG